MMSNLFELCGLAALVVGVYELAGRGWALLVLAGCLMFLGVAFDGLQPTKLARAATGDLAARLRRNRSSD